MPITGRYRHFVCDTIAERDSLEDYEDPNGIQCYVRYPDFTDESDGLLSSDDEPVYNGKFYVYVDGVWDLIKTEPGTPLPPGEGYLQQDEDGNLEWVPLSGGGDMLAANNLSDLTDIDAARVNINAEELGAADAALDDAEDYTDAQVLLLKDSVPAPGDTLAKLYNLIIAEFSEVTVANIAARDAYNVTHLPTNIFVTDDGDASWALYKATTTGVGATFVKLSDPDLLNAAQSASQIKVAYESNSDTNAFTDALLSKLNGITAGATANDTDANLKARANHTGTQLAATVIDFNAAALLAAPAETTSTLGTTGNGAAAKATPVDADLFMLLDSAASWVVKKLTWLNVKDALTTLFNGLYTAKNGAITGATKTKVTYDSKGLVTAGADATQDDIGDGSTYKQFSATNKAKLDFLTVTQAVDLDDIETRVNNLDAAVVLKGTWDASAGTFPGGGTAQAGASYIVSVAGTVNAITWAVGDRIIAILDNASTTTYLNNWFKADYTDAVLSVNGATGAVSITLGGLGATTVGNNIVTLVNPSAVRYIKINSDNTVTARTAAEFLSDIGAQAAGSYLTAANIVATITDGNTTTAPNENAVFDALALKANAASPAITGTPTFASGIPAANLPTGLVNFNVAEQSQLVVSATNYYITNSNINLPNPLKVGLVVGSRITWVVYMSKTNAGTGIFQMSIYRGTNGTTADTQDVLQTIGTQTAVVDTMCVEVTLTVTVIGATGSYFWTISPMHAAATATGFGLATGTTGLFSGTVASVALNTAALKFGLGFKATTGTPTIRIVQVQAETFNIM